MAVIFSFFDVNFAYESGWFNLDSEHRLLVAGNGPPENSSLANIKPNPDHLFAISGQSNCPLQLKNPPLLPTTLLKNVKVSVASKHLRLLSKSLALD